MLSRPQHTADMPFRCDGATLSAKPSRRYAAADFSRSPTGFDSFLAQKKPPSDMPPRAPPRAATLTGARLGPAKALRRRRPRINGRTTSFLSRHIKSIEAIFRSHASSSPHDISSFRRRIARRHYACARRPARHEPFYRARSLHAAKHFFAADIS